MIMARTPYAMAFGDFGLTRCNMAVKYYRFPVTTDAGETGTSETRTINGIISGIRLKYDAAADAGTNVTMRGNDGGDIFTLHEELANSTDKTTVPNPVSPRLVAASCNVYVDSAGGALSPAVTLIAEVLE
jgi:hypothetical protein